MKKVKRITFGAILVAGVVIGTYLNDMLPKMGAGVGIGAQASSTTPDLRPDGEQPEEPKDEPPKLARPEILEVLIDNRDFLVRMLVDGEARYQQLSMKELITFAKQVPGNDDGIKVKIARRESSRATAEMELRDQLLEAGIKDSAVLWQKDFVE
ncbi:MAG: hypothetical protein CMJ78_27260 [Planctomycetaceae bacterium]|nr:hypothetical protein [Planctomycetaceae bacterium]